MPLKRTFRELTDNEFNALGVGDYPSHLAWPGGFDWDALCASPRVLIIAEAGTGKTFECRARHQALWQAGEPAFFLELAQLAQRPIDDQFDTDQLERFHRWCQSQAEIATFFLDSIDELKLTQGSVRVALISLGKALQGHLARSRFVITTRPIQFELDLIRQYLPVPEIVSPPPSDEAFAWVMTRGFAELDSGTRHGPLLEIGSTPPDWRCVTLIPFDRTQRLDFIHGQGVPDPEALLQAIDRQCLQEYVSRPMDLMELCADWREQGRIRSHHEQVEANIRLKLRPRIDRKEKIPLSEADALHGASRLALACLLTKKLTLRHSVEADQPWHESPALDPARLLHDWTADARQTLLERPLFNFVNYGRVGFHHRSVVEFLAAVRLRDLTNQGLTTRALKRLLFTETAQGLRVVKPSLRPVAAWLAAANSAVWDEVQAREPELLLTLADPARLGVDQRRAALRAFAARYGMGGWRGLSVPELQVQRFACPDLAPEVQHLWESGLENTEVRRLLLQLIAAGPLPDCANLAFAVVSDPGVDDGERLAALDGLIVLGDRRLADIVAAMGADDETHWTDRLLKGAILRLFPNHLSVDAFCRILGRVSEAPHSIGDLSWALPKAIAAAKIEMGYLDALRVGLTELVSETFAWAVDDHHPTTQRPDLVESLAAVCLRQLQAGARSEGLLMSCVMATRLAPSESATATPSAALRAFFAQAPLPLREGVFWQTDALNRQVRPQSNAWDRFHLCLLQPGAMELQRGLDTTWVRANLADAKRPVEDRALLLEVAIWLRDPQVDQREHLSGLRAVVEDCPILRQRIDEALVPRPPDPELILLESATVSQRERQRRDEEGRQQAWQAFWVALVQDPNALFDEPRRENTVWNLWLAMRHAGTASRSTGWDRRFIETHFDAVIADRLRTELMRLWRSERPAMVNEEAGIGQGQENRLARWQLGLAGLYAESEDPDWAAKLTVRDAELAARYVPVEFNAFPGWFEALVKAHPEAVDRVLGMALAYELDNAGTDSAQPLTLQYLRHASPAVVGIFLPRVFNWFAGCYQRQGQEGVPDGQAERVWVYQRPPSKRGLSGGLPVLSGQPDRPARPVALPDLPLARLHRAAIVLLGHGDESIRGQLAEMAERALAAGLDNPDAALWLPILLRLKPGAACERLESFLTTKDTNSAAPDADGPGVHWIAQLFGNPQGAGIGLDLHAPPFNPQVLGRLVRLAYRHVRPQDDTSPVGIFTPGQRDAAQQGRNALFNALMSARGAAAYAVQAALAEDPLFVHLRDRILMIAYEQAAVADDPALTDEVVRELDTRLGTPPMTQAEMFQLLIDRLDELEDYLHEDESPRELWATIKVEKQMRREIARFLKDTARGLYHVEQESVTGAEKETDIRLRSTASDHEAVIELKIGDRNYSTKGLCETIKRQLIGKYLLPEHRRSGCLLLTVSNRKTWKHPGTGKNIGSGMLLELLKEHARQLEKDYEWAGKSLRLDVRVLDFQVQG